MKNFIFLFFLPFFFYTDCFFVFLFEMGVDLFRGKNRAAVITDKFLFFRVKP